MFETRLEQGPEWQIVFDLVAGLAIGERVTFEDLSEVLERDWTDNYTPIDRVRRELEEHCQKTLINERGIGYRVAHPREHVGLARIYEKRGKRQLDKATSKVTNVNVLLLSAVELQELKNVRHELDRLNAWKAKSERAEVHQDDRLSALESRMAELNSKLDGEGGDSTTA